MHDAERADENAKTCALPEAEKRDHDAEIQNRLGKEQDTVQHVDPIFFLGTRRRTGDSTP